jgi:hypothetical protein
MVTVTLIARVKNHLKYDLDGYFGLVDSVSDADVVASINDRLKLMCRDIYQFSPSIGFTLTAGSNAYDLRDTSVVSQRVIRVHDVIINGIALRTRKGDRKGLWSLQEVERDYPTWRTDDNGTPTKAFQLGTTLYLHPAPSTGIVTAGNSYISGTYMAPDLSASALGDPIDLPEELHPALALLTAVDVARSYTTENHQFARLQAMEADAMKIVMDVQKENKKLLSSFGTTVNRSDLISL